MHKSNYLHYVVVLSLFLLAFVVVVELGFLVVGRDADRIRRAEQFSLMQSFQSRQFGDGFLSWWWMVMNIFLRSGSEFDLSAFSPQFYGVIMQKYLDFWNTQPALSTTALLNDKQLSDQLSNWAAYAYSKNEMSVFQALSQMAIRVSPEWGTYYIRAAMLELTHHDISRATSLLHQCKLYKAAGADCDSEIGYAIELEQNLQAVKQSLSQDTGSDFQTHFYRLAQFYLEHESGQAVAFPEIYNQVPPFRVWQMWKEKGLEVDWSISTVNDRFCLARLAYQLGLIAAAQNELSAESWLQMSAVLSPEWSYFHIELFNYYWQRGQQQRAGQQLAVCATIPTARESCNSYYYDVSGGHRYPSLGIYEKEIAKVSIR